MTAPDGSVEKVVYHKDGTRTETKLDAAGKLLEEVHYDKNGSFVKTGFKPQLIDGSGQIFKTSGSVSFRSNDEFINFLSVILDGEELSSEHYTATEGSIRVTLEPEFVKTLSVGEHILSIVSTNGTATGSFSIDADEVQADETDSETGFNWLWIILILVIALVGIGFVIIVKRKKQS